MMVRFRVWVGLVVVLGLLGSGLVGAVDGGGEGLVLQEEGGLGSDLFDDVPVGHWADEEVGWAVASGVMEGVGGGRFDLAGVVPRWQIVTFLFRVSRLVGGSVGGDGSLGRMVLGMCRWGMLRMRRLGGRLPVRLLGGWERVGLIRMGW